jgi:hypothetical protein
MSCHKMPAIKKIGIRVLCKTCIDARTKALKRHKAEKLELTKIKENEWDEKRVDVIGTNGNEGLHY